MPRILLATMITFAGLAVTFLANASGQNSCQANPDASDCEAVIFEAIGKGVVVVVIMLFVWGFAEIILGGDKMAGRASETPGS